MGWMKRYMARAVLLSVCLAAEWIYLSMEDGCPLSSCGLGPPTIGFRYNFFPSTNFCGLLCFTLSGIVPVTPFFLDVYWKELGADDWVKSSPSLSSK